MLAAPPNGRLDAIEPGADPAVVLKSGYLPSELRPAVTPLNILRFPLGDIDNFSVCRYAYAQALQRYHGKGEGIYHIVAPWETKYYEAIAEVEKARAEAARQLALEHKIQVKAQGEYVSTQDGGALAPEYWSGQWNDLLRAFSALDQLPVTRFSVPYRITHIPKVSVDITLQYVGENANITPTQAFQFGQVTYTARKAAAVLPVSNELMRDAPTLADQLLRQSTARAIAYDRDLQALTGQGGPNPTGLLTMATNGTISKYYPGTSATASIQAGANHATPSFLHTSQLRGKIHQLNGSSNAPATGQAHCNGMIVHSRFEQTVLTQGTAAGPWTDNNGRPLWMSGLSTSATRQDEDHASDGALLGQVWVLTNILPTNSTDGGGSASSFVIAGWWEMYAIFTSLQVAFDTTMEASYYQSDQTGVRVLARGDTVPIHPEAFAVMAGVDA